LVLDELGYLPIDKRGADLLFQVISHRYERGAMIISTNRAFKQWPEIFNRRESGAKTAPNAVWGRLSLLNSLVVRRFAPSKRRMKFAAIVAEREAFGNNNDAILTSAILDRLLHYAEAVLIEEKSFRMKEVIKS
jgi:DNA replication protein DnaC